MGVYEGDIWTTDSEGITYRVPKPWWRYEQSAYDPFNDNYVLHLEAFWDETRPKFWEIEEEILTTAVVELLREKGYTVIEPGYRTL